MQDADSGYQLLDSGFWYVELLCRILDSSSWILVH